MGGRKNEWTEKKFARYLKEGRGQGVGEKYIPWLKVQDVPSQGRATRAKGWKTNRLHHFFSDHETRLFYLLEWSDSVLDIREQFPLVEVDLTQKIAADIGVRHPEDPKTKLPIVLTTDFMVTVQENGCTQDIAITVKPSSKLKTKRVIDKFDIERNYYLEKNIEWKIVTEKHIPKRLVKNIEWVHGDYHVNENIENPDRLLPILKEHLQDSDSRISKVTDLLDKEMKLESGTFLHLFKYLIARKEVVFDMHSNQYFPDMRTKDIKKIFTQIF